jgi:hypothetical protein
MSTRKLLDFKGVLFRAWRVNLYCPDATSPIPGWIWRRMGAA